MRPRGVGEGGRQEGEEGKMEGYRKGRREEGEGDMGRMKRRREREREEGW